jgi:hypothetical protein
MNIIDATRVAEARRRREDARETAFIYEMNALSMRIPASIRRLTCEAIVQAVRENSPDALARVPPPYRERLIAAFRTVGVRQPASVLPLVRPM